MKKKSWGTVTIVGVIVALVGVVAPIAWDWYKSRIGIELQHLRTTTIVESSRAIEKLQILYDGKPIEKLSKLEFVLINTGRTPILRKDLVEIPTIALLGLSEILEVRTENLSPGNLKYEAVIDSSRNKAQLSFDLLNASDYIHFSLIVAGAIPLYNADARIVGVKNLVLVDKEQISKGHPRQTPWAVYPTGIIGFLVLVLFLVAFVPEVRKILRLRQSFLRGTLLPPENTSSDNLSSFIRQNFAFALPKEKDPVIQFLDSFPAGTALSAADYQKFAKLVDELITESGRTSVGAALMLLSISIIGLGYTISSILR